jgi:hypothetical protein
MQGGREVSAAVNFLDPLESNLFQRTSTWRPLPAAPEVAHPTRPTSLPLANWLALVLLVLLLVEWWRYSLKRPFGVRSSEFGVQAVAPSPEPRAPSVLVP